MSSIDRFRFVCALDVAVGQLRSFEREVKHRSVNVCVCLCACDIIIKLASQKSGYFAENYVELVRVVVIIHVVKWPNIVSKNKIN